MQCAMSASCNHDASNESWNFNEATACFIDQSDESNMPQAKEKIRQHTQLLLPVTDNAPTPQQCHLQFKKLATDAFKPFTPTSDDCNILIILQAGEKYLTCGAANFDVWRLSAFFRSMLYQVGTAAAPNEEMLLQGATFVPSQKMFFIVDEFKHLILFVLRTNPSLITQQMTQATSIHHYVGNEFSGRMKEDEIAEESAKRIIDTNILFGMILSILLEPTDKLKPNTLQLFITGRAIKSVQDKSYLQFYNANKIGKRCNSLLRVFRHFVCGHIVRRARETIPTVNHEVFINTTYQLLQTIQICPSIDSICRCIRMAREIERKSPSGVFKGFNPHTGQIRVDTIYVNREVWSKAICVTAEKLKDSLFRLFACHGLLEHVLNTNNKLVMTGEDNYVYINGESSFLDFVFCMQRERI